MHPRNAKLSFVICCAASTAAFAGLAGAQAPDGASPRLTGPFSPSNARTVDGKLIAEADFFPASRCASCHQDTHAAWSLSLHRNAAREPFYRESADILLRTRGIELTRHCESCHTPIALFSGALTSRSSDNPQSEIRNPQSAAPFTKFDDEGVTCSVCHSIVEARVDGTGSFTLRRPALLAKEDGSPIFGDFTDEQILADVPGHKRAVMRPLLRSPEFCATCHKVVAPPELNGYKTIKGFSAYDEWQQSGASLESVLPFYRRDARADCRACHMPKIESYNDRAAKNGIIASHRWLGANTAAPMFYGQTEQVDLIESFLSSNVLAVDIFALRRAATGELIAPLDSSSENRIQLTPGEEVIAEVVASNRNAAHSFPPEVRDLYEAWVEFEASDETGKTIFHSGYLRPDGMLDESAHVYKQLLLDQLGRVITRHQIWTTTIKAYDNAIQAGRSDLVRFSFRIPEAVVSSSSVRLRARINYRRFNQEYTNYVLSMRNACMAVPVVQMAEATAVIDAQCFPLTRLSGISNRAYATTAEGLTRGEQFRRWNDYGIALLEQAQYGPASEAFRLASQINPTNPDLLVNAAIAELRTERYGTERDQLRKAAALLDSALSLKPLHRRSRYWHAVILRGESRLTEAAATLSDLAKEHPRDREVQRQLGQTLYSLGRLDEARAALETVVAIDPQDAGAYQLLAPIYVSEGQKAQADLARALYLQWRDDPLANQIAARFFAAHPEWSDERVASHAHGSYSAHRPTLTGALANPVK